MINIIKQEITIEESLRQRLEFICEFSHTNPTFINGFIHKVDKTNLSYVEPHKIIIKGITFLVFNYSNRDEFLMQDIDSAFDYIPDESNDSVIYMKDPIPIEIGVKPVRKELLYEEDTEE